MMNLVRMFGRGPRPFMYTFHAPVHKELLAERQGTYALPQVVQKPVVNTLRRVEASVVGQASRVAVLSEFMRTQVAELSPAAAGGAEVIPGGVDSTWFCPGEQPYEDPVDPLLFTARRLTPRTGGLELVEAMASVVARYPQARLAVAGDGHLRSRIEADIARHELEKNVELLGRVSEEDLRAWYRRATLTIMPTAELEGFGLTTAESLLCGTPVLVTPVGANPELVADLDPRFVTSAATPAGIAQGITTLLDSPHLLARAREVLPGDRTRRWSWDAIAAQHVTWYDSARGGRS